MIDLHLHLDGSLSIEDFLYLSKKDNIDLGIDFPNNIYVNNDCASLEEYLERFSLPLKLLQTKENISYVVSSLVDRLYNLGYIYAEIRFAPLLHLEKGLTQKEVIVAACDGLKSSLKNKTDFNANLILCLMRQASDELNIATIKAACELNDPKVVAIDLAGPEAFKKTEEYEHIFKLAKQNNLNVIIHAGEACGNESILGALTLNAKRIGHGVHLALDEENIEKVKHLTFEFCPTSNIQTKSLNSYLDNPIRKFLDKNLKVTINSDNMTVSNTDVYQEFKEMLKAHDLKLEEIKTLLSNSIEAAFVSDEEKNKLKILLDRKIDNFYINIK